MSLHPKSPRRERILGYGDYKAGKSSAWLAIAEWVATTRAKSKLYVIDTDLAWDAMRPEDGHLDEVCTIFPIYEWADYKPAIKTIREKATSDDWWVFDLADKPWAQAQNEYFSRVFGQDLDEFFLQAKVNNTSVGGDYGTHWQVINKLHDGVLGSIPSFRGHVFAAVGVDAIRKTEDGKKKAAWDDDPETIETFGKIGFKPSGQKRLGHMFHTILYFAKSPSGYRLTSVGERNPPRGPQREYLAGEIVKPDFVTTYLMKVAGWKP